MGVQCRMKHPQNGSGGLLRFTLDLSTINKFTIVISNNGARNRQVEVGTNSMWNLRALVHFNRMNSSPQKVYLAPALR